MAIVNNNFAEQNGAEMSAVVTNNIDDERAKNLAHAWAVARRTVDAGIDLTADYEEWVKIGFALTELGNEGRAIYHTVSSLYPGYTMDECDKKYDNLMRCSQRDTKDRPKGVTLASFFHKAKEFGIDVSLPDELKGKPGRPRKASAADGEEKPRESVTSLAGRYINERYALRYNVVTGYTEIAERNADDGAQGKWTMLDDRMMKTIKVRFCKEVAQTNVQTIRDIVESADYSVAYNPITDYLDSLAPWDGEDDAIGRVIDYLKFETPEERTYAHIVMRKWFIAMVALWMDRIPRNDYMPVLVGKEYIGKNYFVMNLIPKGLKSYVQTFDRGTNFKDKDVKLRLSRGMMIVCDEVEMNKSTQILLQQLTSTEDMAERAAFAEKVKTYKRRASFIGMTNSTRFLDHLDGARRFLGLNIVGTVRFEDGTLPIDAAYAQAKAIVEREGKAACEMTKEEVDLIHIHNSEHVVVDFVAEIFDSIYRKSTPDEQANWLMLKDIIVELAPLCNLSINERKLRKHIDELEVEKKTTNRGVKYNLQLMKQTPPDPEK